MTNFELVLKTNRKMYIFFLLDSTKLLDFNCTCKLHVSSKLTTDVQPVMIHHTLDQLLALAFFSLKYAKSRESILWSTFLHKLATRWNPSQLREVIIKAFLYTSKTPTSGWNHSILVSIAKMNSLYLSTKRQHIGYHYPSIIFVLIKEFDL